MEAIHILIFNLFEMNITLNVKYNKPKSNLNLVLLNVCLTEWDRKNHTFAIFQ
jgi:hypothetical protein